MDQITVRAGHARIRQILSALPRVAALSAEIQIRIGMEALSIIKEAFIEKARGGTDAAGLKWKPLSPSTIAYGRRHPGLANKRKHGPPGRPLLTKAQDRRWRAIFASYAQKWGGTQQAKGQAAALAWAILKAEGARTIIGTYGNTPVEILRDTGVLLNSLSPGVNGHSGHPNQIFAVGRGEVIVGTNVPYAKFHHYGTRRMPQRRLWPEPARWPKAWWDRLTQQLLDGVQELAKKLLRTA